MEFIDLLQRPTNEEKLAGLLLSVKYADRLDDSNSTQQIHDLLQQVILKASPLFILRVLQTKQCVNETSVQDTALSLLQRIGGYSDLLKLFSSRCTDIYNILIRTSEPRVRSTVQEFLVKVCIASGHKYCESIFRCILSSVSDITNDNISCIFDILIELVMIFPKDISLSVQESKALRSLMVMGWRGSATEETRDVFMIATAMFLTRLSPGWTVETEDQSVASNGAEQSGQHKGQFAMLLCSVVCGEFRLLLHEYCTLVDTEDKEADATPISPTNSSELSTPAAHYDERVQRAVNMMFVCCDVFDAMLRLLLSEDEGVWENLPSLAMLQFQKEMVASVELFFQFVRQASRSFSVLDSSVALGMHRILDRIMMTFAQWIQEDDSLHEPFVTVLGALLPACSRVPPLGEGLEDCVQNPTAISFFFRNRVLDVLFGKLKEYQECSPNSLSRAYMRVPAADGSAVDVAVTALPVVLRIATTDDDVAAAMRLEAVCAAPLLCTIVGCVLSTVVSCATGKSDTGKSLSTDEMNRCIAVCMISVELLCLVIEGKGSDIGHERKDRDYEDDCIVASYLGVSVAEIRVIFSIIKHTIENSTACQKCSDRDEWEYLMQHLSRLQGLLRLYFSDISLK